MVLIDVYYQNISNDVLPKMEANMLILLFNTHQIEL